MIRSEKERPINMVTIQPKTRKESAKKRATPPKRHARHVFQDEDLGARGRDEGEARLHEPAPGRIVTPMKARRGVILAGRAGHIEVKIGMTVSGTIEHVTIKVLRRMIGRDKGPGSCRLVGRKNMANRDPEVGQRQNGGV